MQISPVFLDRWHKFRSNKRGYYSFLILIMLVSSCFFLELLINSRALVVKYKSEYYFPLFSEIRSESFFGGIADYEVNYRKLKLNFKEEDKGDWVIMPIIPYSPNESIFVIEEGSPPYPPNFETRHFLGTDTLGRDVLSRLFYAFRVTIFFSLGLYVVNNLIGIAIGCLMGYFGGWFDLIFQRIVEIWSNLPVLYVLLIIGSFVTPNIYLLMVIFAILNWTGITWLMRAEILREKKMQYATAATSIGAGHLRVIFFHLLPNSIVPVLANFPFQIIGGISVLTSLDYLGYGLPVPTPSWGELLNQGQQTFDFAPWIVLAPSFSLVSTLLIFAFIGEALRDTLDPRSNIVYY